MPDLTNLLDTLYRNEQAAPSSKEKTAADHFAEALAKDDETVGENPYENMSTAELAQLALSLEQGQVAETGDLDQVKVAQETLGGVVMAHAMIHEFGLIKEAMLDHKCRVCKEHDMDVQGSSICSECIKGD